MIFVFINQGFGYVLDVYLCDLTRLGMNVAFIDLQKRGETRIESCCLNYQKNPLEILCNRNMNHYNAKELLKAVNIQWM